MDIIFGYFFDVFEYEGKGFEIIILNVKFRSLVFIKNSGDISERIIGFGDNSWLLLVFV